MPQIVEMAPGASLNIDVLAFLISLADIATLELLTIKKLQMYFELFDNARAKKL